MSPDALHPYNVCGTSTAARLSQLHIPGLWEKYPPGARGLESNGNLAPTSIHSGFLKRKPNSTLNLTPFRAVNIHILCLCGAAKFRSANERR